jgi:hypothetical protein
MYDVANHACASNIAYVPMVHMRYSLQKPALYNRKAFCHGLGSAPHLDLSC